MRQHKAGCLGNVAGRKGSSKENSAEDFKNELMISAHSVDSCSPKI